MSDGAPSPPGPPAVPIRRASSNRFVRTRTIVPRMFRNPNVGAGNNKVSKKRPSAIARSSRMWVLQKPEDDEENRRSSALSQRLEEILIMELHRDGARHFLQFTVRGLYKHVLSAVTTAPPPHHLSSAQSPMTAVVEPLRGGSDEVREAEEEDLAPGRSSVSFHEHVTVQPFPYPATPPPMPPKRKLERVASARASVAAVPPPTQQTGEGKHEDLTYRERIGGYLHPRDMRRLVTPFSASNEPGLIVRRHVILLNFDPLRAVILRDRLLVLVPRGADSLLSKLEKRVRGGARGAEISVFGTASEFESTANDEDDEDNENGSLSDRSVRDSIDNNLEADQDDALLGEMPDTASKVAISLQGFDGSPTAPPAEGASATDDTSVNSEWEEMNARDWIDLPFELQCADAVLSVVCSILTEDAYELQEAALGYMDSVVSDKFRIGDDPLTGLRHTKDAIREMSSRVKGFVQSMNRILDDDEDMALMNLSRLLTHPERFTKPVNPVELEEEADEPELILEAHLQIGLTLMNALDLIQGRVESASELVDQKLDSVRNRILFANTIIMIFTLAMTTSAVVGAFFGMNVEVPWGDNHQGLGPFTGIVVGSLCCSLVIVVMTMALLFYTQAIPMPGASLAA